MSRRRHTPEQIITALREAEVGLANGKTVGMVSRELGISEQTYYRWRQEFGGMKVDQARRFKELEKENARLKRAVANLTVDKLILEEATKGNIPPRENIKKSRGLGACDLPPRAVPHPMLVPAPVEGREGRASSGTRATA